jgi:hypothetical protein
MIFMAAFLPCLSWRHSRPYWDDFRIPAQFTILRPGQSKFLFLISRFCQASRHDDRDKQFL